MESRTQNAEVIIEKLNKMPAECDTKYVWADWSLEELHKLLSIYLIISKNEAHIFDLIYENHGCDSWEEIFRDYDATYLEDKAIGVEIAIETIAEEMQN